MPFFLNYTLFHISSFWSDNKTRNQRLCMFKASLAPYLLECTHISIHIGEAERRQKDQEIHPERRRRKTLETQRESERNGDYVLMCDRVCFSSSPSPHTSPRRAAIIPAGQVSDLPTSTTPSPLQGCQRSTNQKRQSK